MNNAAVDWNYQRIIPQHDPGRPKTPLERLYDDDEGAAMSFFDHLIDRELDGNDTLYHLVIDCLNHRLIRAEAKRWSEGVINATDR